MFCVRKVIDGMTFVLKTCAFTSGETFLLVSISLSLLKAFQPDCFLLVSSFVILLFYVYWLPEVECSRRFSAVFCHPRWCHCECFKIRSSPTGFCCGGFLNPILMLCCWDYRAGVFNFLVIAGRTLLTSTKHGCKFWNLAWNVVRKREKPTIDICMDFIRV